jgi:plasmid stabilization system protein ParE
MKVVWSRRAIRHLVHLREYIERDSEQNAALVASRIPKGRRTSPDAPRYGPPRARFRHTRTVVPAIPYIIPYRVRRNRLELIAVFHGRQKWPPKF